MTIERIEHDGDATIISVLRPARYYGDHDDRWIATVSPRQQPTAMITRQQMDRELSLVPYGLYYSHDLVDVKGVGTVVFISEHSGFPPRGWQDYDSYGRHENVTGPFLLVESLYARSGFEGLCQNLITDFQALNVEIAQYFADHPERLLDLSWREFEQLLYAIFRNQGFTAELGLGRNDHGIDLRLMHKDSIGELLTVVQAKRYDPSYPIGLEPVAALHGVVQTEGAHRGLFVTTSRYLPSAKRFAERQHSRLVLADSADVARWCARLPHQRS